MKRQAIERRMAGCPHRTKPSVVRQSFALAMRWLKRVFNPEDRTTNSLNSAWYSVPINSP
ncbi:hypothetical protein Pla52n_48340 [Stieleria varia]|uniref:Uncharacterized protein n=1 Tax=Stieleria varia TaxID=2528005 RepID=A0A5C6AE49_9BACT|nr:hypothetical protein Pla52n_48340 [Stieleria varia]